MHIHTRTHTHTQLKNTEWERNRSRVAEIKMLLEGVDREVTLFRQEMMGKDEDDYE